MALDFDRQNEAFIPVGHVDAGMEPSPQLLARPEVERPSRSRLLKLGKNAGILTVAAGVYAFEQSWLNETFRANVATEMLEASDNYLAVGSVVAGITMAVETISGVATAATMTVKEGLIGRFNGWATRRADRKVKTTNKKGKPVGDTLLALGGGATPVVIKRHIEAGGRTFAENNMTAVKAAGGIAVFSGLLAGAGGAFIEYQARRGHVEGAQQAMDILADSKTWLSLYIGGWGIAKAKQVVGAGIRRVKGRHNWQDALPALPTMEVMAPETSSELELDSTTPITTAASF